MAEKVVVKVYKGQKKVKKSRGKWIALGTSELIWMKRIEGKLKKKLRSWLEREARALDKGWQVMLKKSNKVWDMKPISLMVLKGVVLVDLNGALTEINVGEWTWIVGNK